jgi:hypothetical protein
MSTDVTFDEALALFIRFTDEALASLRAQVGDVTTSRFAFSPIQGFMTDTWLSGDDIMSYCYETAPSPGIEQYCVVYGIEQTSHVGNKWGFAVQLTLDEHAVLFDFVRLGACLGYWNVHGVPNMTGHLPEAKYVDELALIALFGDSQFEVCWPERSLWFAAAWHYLQARAAKNRVPAPVGWELSDTPDYMMP